MRVNRSTKWFVNLGFGAVMLAVTGIGLLAYLNIRQTISNARWVTHTQNVIGDLTALRALIGDTQRGVRGYVIEGNEAYLRIYNDGRQALPERLSHLQHLFSDNPRQTARLRRFREELPVTLDLLEQVVMAQRTGGFGAAQAFIQAHGTTAAVERATTEIAAMQAEEQRLLQIRNARVDKSTQRTTSLMLFSSIATLVFLAGALYVINRDIDAQRAAEEALRVSQEEFRALVETSGSFIVAIDQRLVVTVFNREAENLSGLSAREVIGRPLAAAFGSQPGYGAFEGLLRRALSGVEVHDFDAPLLHAGGEAHVLLWNVDRFANAQGETRGAIAVGTEITERKRMEKLLQHEATHDALTGLLNRRAFADQLHAYFGTVRPHPGAVLFLDLDRFKQVNDTLGHHVGDRLLQEVARRLTGCVRASDCLARLGGDEFAVLLHDADRREAEAVAARILDTLRRPYHIDGHDARISASVGLVPAHASGVDVANDLLRDADVAMYRAKATGRDRFSVSEDARRPEAQRRQRIEQRLRGAAGRGELVLHYQPLVRLRDGKLSGFEALVRWQHPELGLVPPVDFIPMAEENGLIVEVGNWVTEKACRQLCAWGKMRPDGFDLIMAVNYAREQFLQPDAADRVEGILRTCGFSPRQLVIEITERVLERNGADVIEGLPLFRHVGVQLALDDFGTGFSSLSVLGEMSVQHLKLDMGFVRGMGASGARFEVVRGVVELAHRLGMEVVAEGIETPEQLAVLRGLGCDYGQGYFLARPLDVATATEVVLSGGPWRAAWPVQA